MKNSLFNEMAFSDNEKEASLPLVQKMLEYSALSRRRGILAFENVLDNEQDAFLKTALQMAADAVHPQVIENKLNDTIKTDNPAGAQLLERQIITQGVLSIVEGENPRIIAKKITSLFGDNYASRIEELIPSEPDETTAAPEPINEETISLFAKTLSEKYPNADLGELNNDSEKLLSMIKEAGLLDKLPKVNPEKMEDILLDIMLTWAADFCN